MVILSHSTAFMITRALRVARAFPDMARIDARRASTSNLKAVRELAMRIDSDFNSETILHLLVLERQRRQTVPGACVHYSSLRYGRGSFVSLSPDVAMSGPELLFLQMASVLDEVRLFLLGLELCGSYSVDKRHEHGFASELPPVTNPQRIASFIERMPGSRHVRDARKVAGFLMPFSASPQESRLFIKLAGPRSMGGYGVGGLEFNYETSLGADAREIAGQTFCRIDLAHPRARVAIEYESALIHANEVRGQRDKRRRDALVRDGWSVASIVPSTMNSVVAFDAVARDILGQVGQCPRIRKKGFEQSRDDLFRVLRVPD